MEYTDLIELYEERVCVRFYDASDVLERDHGGDEALHLRWAEQQAYFDLRRLVGPKVSMPDEIATRARKYRADSHQ